jgi:branched-chain amino acid transport system substrate-binding protein
MKHAHFFIIGLFAIIVTFVACGQLQKRPSHYASEATPEIAQDYQQANGYYLKGDMGQAAHRFIALIKDHPYNLYTDWARYRLGEIELRQKNYGAARAWFYKARKGEFHPQVTPLSQYKEAVASYYLQDHKRALKTLKTFPWSRGEAVLQVRAASLEVKSAQQQGQLPAELHGFLVLLDAYEKIGPGQVPHKEPWIIHKRQAYQAVRSWVEEEGTDQALVNTLLEDFSGGVAGGYILWKGVRTAYYYDDLARARILLGQFIQAYPKNEYAAGSRLLEKELNMRASDFKIPIGVILPLSGKFKVYGEAALHGIECAAGIYKPCESPLGIQLIIKDSEGSPRKAQAAVRELAAQKVLGIVGPLSQNAVTAAADEAQKQGVPMLTLSQKQGVPQIGSYIFRNFLTIPDQVFSVVNHVCPNAERKRFAILYPDNSVGKEYYHHYQVAVEKCGGTVTAEGNYKAETTDFKDAIRSLKFSIGERLKDTGLGFDYLYIPDSYRRASAIVKDLPFLNIEGVQLLGSAGWNHPGLTQELKDHVQGAVFVAGFFPQSQNEPTQNFNSDFLRTFSFTPTFLEAYGYDAMRMIVDRLEQKKVTSREGLKQALSKLYDYPGVTGQTSFDADGDAKRRLFLLTIKGSKIEEIL